MTVPSTARPAASAAPAAASGRAAASQLRGTLLMVASTVFFACSDVVTKELAGRLPAMEVTWLRYVTFGLMVIPFALAKDLARGGGVAVFRSRRPGLQVLRGFGMAGSAMLFTASLPYLPVAEATAIYFVSPILIMALSIPFLGETVGWRRWSAALVGLSGVLLVIRPGTSAFEAAAVLPLLGASSWAMAAVVTRKMSGRDPAETTLVYSALVGIAVLSLILPFVFVMPGPAEIGFGLAMGVLSTLGHWIVILAYRHADASVIAPFSYVQLLWAGILGYLVFGSVPDAWTVAGAAIIALSGFYTAYRERVRAAGRA
ncbi:DMT family transporter [Microvirga thermotolerans]|uniref:EamA family transporter n=1 Tax=Microvirga thermotolerans TaxID=2651334 RepID=A0A5P9K2H6_9HYPH|nr:DMT family transporter [Microvirga thermotolerans]QFU17900.1 EamA family transporter [Microvirga thermotolerans]